MNDDKDSKIRRGDTFEFVAAAFLLGATGFFLAIAIFGVWWK